MCVYTHTHTHTHTHIYEYILFQFFWRTPTNTNSLSLVENSKQTMRIGWYIGLQFLNLPMKRVFVFQGSTKQTYFPPHEQAQLLPSTCKSSAFFLVNPFLLLEL